MKTAVALLLALCLSACGHSATSSSGDGHAPSPDPRTNAYVALVQSVYVRYNTARGDAYSTCVVSVDPPSCHDHGVAMIAVWEQFLKDLDTTPPPLRFVPEDRAVRTGLPLAVGALKDMVAAAERNDSVGVVQAADAYISDMQPNVTNALGDVYAPWRTN